MGGFAMNATLKKRRLAQSRVRRVTVARRGSSPLTYFAFVCFFNNPHDPLREMGGQNGWLQRVHDPKHSTCPDLSETGGSIRGAGPI